MLLDLEFRRRWRARLDEIPTCTDENRASLGEFIVLMMQLSTGRAQAGQLEHQRQTAAETWGYRLSIEWLASWHSLYLGLSPADRSDLALWLFAGAPLEDV